MNSFPATRLWTTLTYSKATAHLVMNPSLTRIPHTPLITSPLATQEPPAVTPHFLEPTPLPRLLATLAWGV